MDLEIKVFPSFFKYVLRYSPFVSIICIIPVHLGQSVPFFPTGCQSHAATFCRTPPSLETTGAPCPETVYTGWSTLHRNTTGWPNVHWNTTGRPGEYFQGTLEHHRKNLVENAPLECHRRNSDYCSLEWNTTGGGGGDYNSPHAHAHMVKQSSLHASLKWQDGKAPNSRWTCSGNAAFIWNLLLCSAYQVLLFTRVSTSTLLCVCMDIITVIVFVVFWGWTTNEISSAQTSLVIPVANIRSYLT